MPTIELWEKTGKGAIKFLHNIKRPVEAVALENADGSLFPIYEGHNEVPTGAYNIILIRPYAKDGADVFHRTGMTVEAWNEKDVIHLVNIGDFFGGYMPYQGKAWEKYKQSNAEKLERPVGWLAENAQRMLLGARNR